jgi:hypothetical protein
MAMRVLTGIFFMLLFYLRDHSALETDHISMIGNNHLIFGDFTLFSSYPEADYDPLFIKHFKAIKAEFPYLEVLNETTL